MPRARANPPFASNKSVTAFVDAEHPWRNGSFRGRGGNPFGLNHGLYQPLEDFPGEEGQTEPGTPTPAARAGGAELPSDADAEASTKWYQTRPRRVRRSLSLSSRRGPKPESPRVSQEALDGRLVVPDCDAASVPEGVIYPRGPAVRARLKALGGEPIRHGSVATPRETIPSDVPITVQSTLENAASQFRREFLNRASGGANSEERVLMSYQHLWGLDMRLRYNRRSTRGRGLRLLGGEVVIHSSLDEYCYARAVAPGFVFSDRNRLLLFNAAVAHAEHYGYSVTTASGTCSFKAGHRNALLGLLARRAAEGVLFRENVEAMNLEIAADDLARDWRAHLAYSRNIVDIGLVERIQMSARRKFSRLFGLAQARPPRQ